MLPEKLRGASLGWMELCCPQLPSAMCCHPRECQQKRLCSEFMNRNAKHVCLVQKCQPSEPQVASDGVFDRSVPLPCWWKFISGSFCVREGVCSFEGGLGTWGMWSHPWRAHSAIGMSCYLEALLARGGVTHCILLALLPSTPDGDEHWTSRRTVSTWCSASPQLNFT